MTLNHWVGPIPTRCILKRIAGVRPRRFREKANGKAILESGNAECWSDNEIYFRSLRNGGPSVWKEWRRSSISASIIFLGNLKLLPDSRRTSL
jgi:hypothetical protein